MNVYGITLDGADLWLLAIAGACLAWFIPHLLSASRDKQSAFRAASAKFRSDIFKALNGIYPKTGIWNQNISQGLLATIPEVISAYTEFYYYIPFFRRRAFRKTLLAYENQCKQEGPFEMLLLHKASPADCPENPQTVFGQHVEKLLSFAKET